MLLNTKQAMSRIPHECHGCQSCSQIEPDWHRMGQIGEFERIFKISYQLSEAKSIENVS